MRDLGVLLTAIVLASLLNLGLIIWVYPMFDEPIQMHDLIVVDEQEKTFILDTNLTLDDCSDSAQLFTQLPHFPVVYCERTDP